MPQLFRERKTATVARTTASRALFRDFFFLSSFDALSRRKSRLRSAGSVFAIRKFFHDSSHNRPSRFTFKRVSAVFAASDDVKITWKNAQLARTMTIVDYFPITFSLLRPPPRRSSTCRNYYYRNAIPGCSRSRRIKL